MVDLSQAMTPAMVAKTLRNRGIMISERTLRERARRIGAFREIGKAMFFMPEDIEALLEAAKPAQKPPTLSANQWTDKDTANLRATLIARERRK
ncbi:hypothetical protein DSM25558_0162 [Agrobacterium sp. DSM 25558]|uniref:hypothetical protein n=1 Tax=Agrobacterium sp. DSM 25558 TaxID=1907665 RepID=UPI0009725C0D|nr:hypothetical protein [Agrobacterium sp. DSM 25558]SCX00693.1 hypothetical protein DSM25558_0162 [Agrobacterium sp. DSM 25558]